MEIASSVDRVPQHTAPGINQLIEQRTQESINRYRGAPRDKLFERLRELDHEWDIERAIEANAAIFSLVGLTLATTVNRRWLALPGAVALFLLQHAVQGWCPPVPVLRRMRFRTPHEIESERCALMKELQRSQVLEQSSSHSEHSGAEAP
jgi:hypothetical protein